MNQFSLNSLNRFNTVFQDSRLNKLKINNSEVYDFKILKIYKSEAYKSI